MNKAFFLDRDGTINVDYNYVHQPNEWTWCDGAVEAIKWMNRNHFKVIVVTNQSGIVKGRYKEDQVHELHKWVDIQLANLDAHVDFWYIAPYHPEYDEPPFTYDPSDRKPGTGMFEKARKQFDIDYGRSYMAGDKISDLKPALELGITPFFIRSRHEPNQDRSFLDQKSIPKFDNIGQVIDHIEAKEGHPYV